MAKASRKKLIQIDGMYIFIAIFGLLGGITLLQGYADTKPPITSVVGRYSLVKYATGQKNMYKVSLSKNLLYCISPTTETKDSFIFLINPSRELAIQLNPVTSGSQCFTPNEDYPLVTLRLPTDIGQPTVLSVSNK